MPAYVYGIIDNDREVSLDGMDAVGAPSTSPRVVSAGALAAVVSDAPEDVRPKRRDLAAHQNVLTSLGEQGPVLPMRFGMVAPDERAVVVELTAHQDGYVERLRAVGSRVEFVLRASQDENTALREVLEVNPKAREQSANGWGGGTLEQRMELGETIAAELTDIQQRLREEILRELVPTVAGHVIGDPPSGAFLNVSFLVDRSDADAFVASANRAVERHADQGVTSQMHGPLPPYSFV
jgi:hypothetical protein